jgi:hypothetical protein
MHPHLATQNLTALILPPHRARAGAQRALSSLQKMYIVRRQQRQLLVELRTAVGRPTAFIPNGQYYRFLQSFPGFSPQDEVTGVLASESGRPALHTLGRLIGCTFSTLNNFGDPMLINKPLLSLSRCLATPASSGQQ